MVISFHVFIFAFLFIILRGGSKKVLQKFMLKSVLRIFSSKSFIVSGLTVRSLIHFEFIFVYKVREFTFVEIYFLFGGKFIYDVVLISASHNYTYITSLLSLFSFPQSLSHPLGHYRVPGWAHVI